MRRRLQIRTERIEMIQFGGAIFEIREISNKKSFFDFRILRCRPVPWRETRGCWGVCVIVVCGVFWRLVRGTDELYESFARKQG